MRVYLLTIGHELLNGDTVNTNASWIGQFFAQRGIDVVESLTLRDDQQAIYSALDRALAQSDLVLVTGGLGPTHDDITKKCMATYFKCGMRRDQQVLDHVQALFAKRGVQMQPINYMQADVPENAEVLFNDLGTAPGMWFQLKEQAVVSMPGVPYEMKFLIKERVWPKLKERFGLKTSVYRSYFRTAGIGESNLSEELLPDLSAFLNDKSLSMAFLPSAGEVRLRVNALDTTADLARKRAEPLEQYIREQCEGVLYSEDRDEELPEAVGRVLKQKGWMMATAESCTGGDIASAVTDIAGSSAYFAGSVLAYSNQVKESVLKVSHQDLLTHGAVSKQVALQMAKGAAELTGADIAVSTTGVAGPGGGSLEKPVGTIWFGIYTAKEHFAIKAYLSKDRLVNKLRATKLALETIRRVALGIPTLPYELERHFLE